MTTEYNIRFTTNRIRNGEPRFILLQAVAKQQRRHGEPAATKPLCSPKKLRASSSSHVPATPPESEIKHCEDYIRGALWSMCFSRESDLINLCIPKISHFFLQTASELGVGVGFMVTATIEAAVTDDEFNDLATMMLGETETTDVINMDVRRPQYEDRAHIPMYNCADGDPDDDDADMYYDDVYGDDTYLDDDDDDSFDDAVDVSMSGGVLRTSGVPMEVMESLRRDGKVVEDEELEGKQCIVCLQEFSCSSIDVLKIPCSHLFHDSCISEWFRTNASCPLCRKAIQ